ncbi:hypothetical protein [Rhizobium nepotum]|uniref:hypothetical protein n=1 Tax=Rhizobium nepotum TaxID=1035271 RepID=UPI003CE9C97F
MPIPSINIWQSLPDSLWNVAEMAKMQGTCGAMVSASCLFIRIFSQIWFVPMPFVHLHRAVPY